MMENHLIEKNNGMSADDGGSSDLDETEDQEDLQNLDLGETEAEEKVENKDEECESDDTINNRNENENDNDNNDNDNNDNDNNSGSEIRKRYPFPVRPDAVDCAYYLITGTCNFGSNCEFNHPVRRKNQGSVGSDAFPTFAQYYKAHDGDLGLRQRRRTNVSYSEDDQHQETHIQNNDLNEFPVEEIKYPAFVQYKPTELSPDNPSDEDDSFLWDDDEDSQLNRIIHRMRTTPLYGMTMKTHEVPSEDDFINSSLDLRGVDVDSQMISPHRTVTAAAGTEHRIDNMPGGNSNDERKGWDFEWIFVITNVVLECMLAIFAQLSSKQKPQYALFGVILSFLALLTCIIEIIYEGHQQIPIQRGTLSNNRSQRDEIISEGHQEIPIQRGTSTLNNIVALACAIGKSFATLSNIVALACALGECVVTTINYRFEDLIKLQVLPIILANGVLFSKILKYWQRSRTSISSKKTQ